MRSTYGDDTNSYAWDRSNRLLSMGGVSYAYDGLNNRVSQAISSTVTPYLLDLQPGLSVVLAATTDANTDRYIHGPRGMADNTGAVQWSGSYGPYGNDFGEVGVSQTPYGFTGEPTNVTGLVHLRARDYNPALGIFTALDPLEGMPGLSTNSNVAVGELLAIINGYSYVGGNPINRVDLSGMCPLLNEPGLVNQISARQCHDLVTILRGWQINVVWQEDSVASVPCLPQTVDDVVNQSQSIRQRWTTGEVRSIYNAARIFRAAQNNIGFDPLRDTITLEKRRETGTENTAQQAALGLTVGRTITLSARWWGEGSREFTYVGQEQPTLSIDRFARDPQQYRSWIVLHEMGHVFTTERAINLEALYQRLTTEVPVFRSAGYFPTRYANNSDPKEYLLEAIAGVWWNSGYSVVNGYDSGAGGRTSPIDLSFDDRPIYFGTPDLTTEDPNDTFPLVVINVDRDIWRSLGASISLQGWILTNILTQ